MHTNNTNKQIATKWREKMVRKWELGRKGEKIEWMWEGAKKRQLQIINK